MKVWGKKVLKYLKNCSGCCKQANHLIHVYYINIHVSLSHVNLTIFHIDKMYSKYGPSKVWTEV
jgi:hypothetical protein